MRTAPALVESEIGVPTGIPGFTLRLLAGGAEAMEAFVGSGLAQSGDGEHDADDLLRIAGLPDAFLVIGYFHAGSVGFILGQTHLAGKGKVHLFLHRAWTQGKREWSREAWRFVDAVARGLGCDAMSAIVPNRIARSIDRVYGFEQQGAYVVRKVESGGMIRWLS